MAPQVLYYVLWNMGAETKNDSTRMGRKYEIQYVVVEQVKLVILLLFLKQPTYRLQEIILSFGLWKIM